MPTGNGDKVPPTERRERGYRHYDDVHSLHVWSNTKFPWRLTIVLIVLLALVAIGFKLF
jgi:hypothetical protein